MNRMLSTSRRIEETIAAHIGKFVDLYYTKNDRTTFARGIIVDIQDHVLHLTSDTWGDYYLDLRSAPVFTTRFCEPEEAERLLKSHPEMETKTTV